MRRSPSPPLQCCAAVALTVRRSGRAAALVSPVQRGTAALGRRYLGPYQPAEPWSFKTLIGLPDTMLNNLVHRFDQVGWHRPAGPVRA